MRAADGADPILLALGTFKLVAGSAGLSNFFADITAVILPLLRIMLFCSDALDTGTTDGEPSALETMTVVFCRVLVVMRGLILGAE